MSEHVDAAVLVVTVMALLQEEVKLPRSPTLCPGFIGNVPVSEPDHHHCVAAPINPTFDFSYTLNLRLAIHLLRPSENFFYLCFRHTIVDFFVVLPGQFRLKGPCMRRRCRQGWDQHDEQSKTSERLHVAWILDCSLRGQQGSI